MNQINKPPDFSAMSKEFMKLLGAEAAVRAVRFFKGSFDKGGFTDYTFIPWVKRMDDEEHPLLRDKNRLRNSIHVIENRPDRIVIGVDRSIPYAEIHNTGGTVVIPVTEKYRRYCWAMFMKLSGGKPNANHPDHVMKWKYMALTQKRELRIHIPQRQFIGESETLKAELDEMVEKRFIRSIQNHINNT